MNAKQVENLKNAINLAAEVGNAGGCRYISDGKPDCVVGQLAAIEGVTTEELFGWGKTNIQSVADSHMPGSEKLEPYGIGTLHGLQRIWDKGEGTSTECEDSELIDGECKAIRKKAMLDMVNSIAVQSEG